MKTNSWWLVAAFIVAGISTTNNEAAETAIVKGNTINVRGQPSLIGEVITQLKKGETVTVLEEITVKKPKTDEPDKWARILMPTNTPVWVNRSFVDLTNNVVIPSRLNVRAGPGENFSVVGLLNNGDTVKPIRTVDTWMEIECPTNAYAFVALNLLTPTTVSTTPPPTATETNKLAEAPAKTATTTNVVETTPSVVSLPLTNAPPPTAVDTVTNAVVAQTPSPAPTNAPSGKIEPPALTNPALANPPALATPPPIGAPVPKVEAPSTRRMVRREGIVRGFVSIVAPTGYELRNPENGKVMDYLLSTTTNINLKKYRGKKVVVTGEESLDERWPATPVLKLETLEVAP